jgi:hypothetical protein
MARCGGVPRAASKPKSVLAKSKGKAPKSLTAACKQFMTIYKNLGHFAVNPFTGRKVKMIEFYPKRNTPLSSKIYAQCQAYVRGK